MPLSVLYPDYPVVGGDLDSDYFKKGSNNQITINSTYSTTKPSYVPAATAAGSNFILAANGTWTDPGSPDSVVAAKVSYAKPKVVVINSKGGNPDLSNSSTLTFLNPYVAYVEVPCLVIVEIPNQTIYLPSPADATWKNSVIDHILCVKMVGAWAGDTRILTKFANGINYDPGSETTGIVKKKLTKNSGAAVTFRWADDGYWLRIL